MPSVHDLPVELLAYIFRSISPIEHRDIRLAHVCSLWRATLQRTPEFWATFLTLPSLITQDDHERSVGFWYSFIGRTRCQPLRLRLEGGDFDLLRTIPEHLPRLAWLHVRWRTANPKDIQRRLLATGPLPGLKHLQLICAFPAPETNFLDLDVAGLANSAPLVEEYPQLRHLEVNPDFFIPSMVVRSLTTFIIHRGHMSFATLLPALAQCPALKILQIHHVFFRETNGTSQPVDLPDLRELFVNYKHEPGASTLHHLLSHMRCPSMAQLTILLSSHTLTGLLPEPQPLPIARPLTKLVVQISDAYDVAPRKYTLTVEGYVAGSLQNAPRLRIINTRSPWQDPDGWEFSPLHSITHYFRHSPITDLQLGLLDEKISMAQDDWSALFGAFPALVALSVQIMSCSTFLKVLRHTPLWLPKLKRLALGCGTASGVPYALVVTLRVRATQGHRLQRFEYCHLKSETPPLSNWHLDRLRHLAAQVVVVQ